MKDMERRFKKRGELRFMMFLAMKTVRLTAFSSATQRKTEYTLGSRLHMGVLASQLTFLGEFCQLACIISTLSLSKTNFCNLCLKTNNGMAIWSYRTHKHQPDLLGHGSSMGVFEDSIK